MRTMVRFYLHLGAHMIAARWTDATVGGDRMTDHTAPAQDGGEVTVTNASKTLGVGERGIYHAKNVLSDAAGRLPRAPHDQETAVHGQDMIVAVAIDADR